MLIKPNLKSLRPWIVAAGVLVALLVSGSATFAGSGPFADMAGVWSGSGTISLDSGANVSTGLLYVIDEAQTFLPSQKPAISLSSGIKLVAQARKYGLGMIIATQAPRGIHNQVVSNCTTQFFGRQNAPATIGAAQEIIAASGGRADDLGKLKAGEFYFATEGSGKPSKLRTPICLTYHPPNPPTPDEVIARAKRLGATPKQS